jgi:hypothetical protein
MARSKQLARYCLRLIGYLLNATLFLTFFAQALIAGCLLFLGYVPLPASWVDHAIAKSLPEGIEVRFENARLRGTRFFLTAVEAYQTDVRQAILTLDSVAVEFEWRSIAPRIRASEVSITGGTVFTPSIYAPSGQHTPLLEKIALTIEPRDGSGWQIKRIATLHEDIRLWGSADFPAPQSKTNADASDLLSRFYSLSAQLTAQKQRIEYFDSPTIVFKVEQAGEEAYAVSVLASSPELNHPEIRAENAQLSGKFLWQGTGFSFLEAPAFSASRIELKGYALQVSDGRFQSRPEQSTRFSRESLPDFTMAAAEIRSARYAVDAPILRVDLSKFPQLSFRGAALALGGAMNLNGDVDLDAGSGSVRARGSGDLTDLAPAGFLTKLPEVHFDTIPQYDLSLNFEQDFRLNKARLMAHTGGLQVGDTHIDQADASLRLTEGRFLVDELSLSRGQQWLDLSFALDRGSHDFRLSLVGSAIPDDYNALLPMWWGKLFQDFDFKETARSHGDFVIHGNTDQKAAPAYFGHAEAEGVVYRGQMIDRASLVVRGQGPYTELSGLEAHIGDGWVRGEIGLTASSETISGPMAVRLDLEAKLPLADAGRLAGPSTARLIEAFKTDAQTEIHLEAALFNDAYPQYANANQVYLKANCPEPISYQGIPFGELSFQLHGRRNAIHLRELAFTYADGRGSAMADIFTATEAVPKLRYKLDLVDMDQYQAIAHLPESAGLRENFLVGSQPSPAANSEAPANAGRVDLQLHGQGPANDLLSHNGYGQFEIRNERLATIQLLGPLSKLLQNTELNFTSFNLDTMHGAFAYADDQVRFAPLQIDGLRTRIRAPGSLSLRDQSIDMRVSIFLFGNAGDPESRLRQIGDLIKRPLPNLLEFELSGTLQEQKFRSLYDPRNLLPNL